MTDNTRFQTFDVLPTDHESIREDQTIFKLSGTDQIVPGSHTRACVIFPLSLDSLDRDQFISYLCTGLQNLVTHIPLVGGQLHNTEDGIISILRHNHQPVQLNVHHLDTDPGFPSYETLSASSFTPSLFSDIGSRLFPPNSNIGGFRRDEGCPVSFYQANFIRGGLLLTLALHHMCGDAKSIDHVFSLWATSTRAAKDGQSMPTWSPHLNRSYFTALSTPSVTETEELKKLIHGYAFQPLTNEGPAKTVVPPTLPPMSLEMYHFSTDTCMKLKNLCKPSDPEKFVSSYDCILGLTWRCMTRARVPYLKLDLENTKTRCGHAVDTRGRFGGTVPKEYFGNGFTMGVTEDITIAQLIGEDGLPKAAQAMRQSILDVKENSIPALVSVRKGIQGREQMSWIFQPQNIMGTSWTGMQPFTKYDFGYGLPVSISLLASSYEGTVGVLPANRVGTKSDGFDVYVSLEKGCQERLMADPEYQAYCTLIK
jgi:hypothetical protein